MTAFFVVLSIVVVVVVIISFVLWATRDMGDR